MKCFFGSKNFIFEVSIPCANPKWDFLNSQWKLKRIQFIVFYIEWKIFQSLLKSKKLLTKCNYFFIRFSIKGLYY